MAILGLVYGLAARRARRTEQLVTSAISSMVELVAVADTSPQRALLRSVAEVLVVQERVADQLNARIFAAYSTGQGLPGPDELLRELLAIAEPQQLICQFLAEYAGGPGSEAVFDALGTEMTRGAIARAFASLADTAPAHWAELLLAMDGGLAVVAAAAAAIPWTVEAANVSGSASPGSWGPPPRVMDLDAEAVSRVVQALDGLTRRQLRLATVLYGQAGAVVALRKRRAGKGRGRPVPATGPVAVPADATGWLARLRHTASARGWRDFVAWTRPRLMAFLRPGAFSGVRSADLASLEVVLDSVGEVVDVAGAEFARGEPCQAINLLAGVRVPAPAGLPGRRLRQESLAQVRPLAEIAAWHRLAVSRWGLTALAAARAAVPEAGTGTGGGPDPGITERDLGAGPTVPSPTGVSG